MQAAPALTNLESGLKMRSLAYGLAVAFVFAVPWENAIHVANVGRITKVLGVLTIAVWAISVLARGRFRQPGTFQKAYFLFLIWSGLTIYWSIAAGTSMRGFVTYTEIFGMLLIFWDLCDRQAAIRTCLQAYVLGAYITCGSLIVTFFTAPPARFPGHVRFQALGYETDGIALVVAIAAPAAWYLATGPPSRRFSPALRLVNYAYVPLALFAVVLTGTRGATFASIPTAIFILWSLRHASAAKRIVAVVALAAAAVAVIGYAPRGPLARIGTAVTVADTGEGALSGRLSIWAQSRDAFFERPVGGFGIDGHRTATPVGKEAHNTYLSVLVETGIVGFVLFMITLVSVFARVRHRSGRELWYWLAQLSVLVIGAMSLSLEDSKSVWLFLSFAFASAVAAEGRASELVRPLSNGRRAPPGRDLLPDSITAAR